MIFTEGTTEATPREVGYDASRLEVLKGHFQKAIDDKEIHCATYCIARRGKIFAAGGLGKKSFREDDDTPAAPDNIRRIASITKIFTAVAVMKLVEDGLVSLETPVCEILPQFDTPPYNGINLFHLLTHTSGMHADGGCFENKYQMNYWGLIEGLYNLQGKGNDKFDWIKASLSTIGSGLRVPIGLEWAYCSYGFVILGAVIERVTGIHAHKYIEDNICKPLGMNDTSFALTPETVRRYIITDSETEKIGEDIIGGTYEPQWVGEKLNIPETGGGLHSTVYDLIRFGKMVLAGGTLDGNRVIGRKALERMTAITVTLPDYCWDSKGGMRRYGIGFDHRNSPQFTFSETTVMHEGAGACALYMDPEEDITAAWIVPYVDQSGWFPRVMYNTQNIIWSGII